MAKRMIFLICICIPLIPGVSAADRIEDWTNHFDGKLIIGGEIRLRGEARQDYDFYSKVSSLRSDDRLGLSRIRLNFDVKPVEQLRLFTEIQDSRDYKAGVSRRIGAGALEDRVDFFQLYADIKNFNTIPLTVRLGRQTLLFGDQRLVGPFGWSNVGRSFQGIRLIYRPEPVEVNVWWVNVVVPEDGELNEPKWDDDFFGVHATCKRIYQGQLDMYLLLRDKSDTATKIYTIGSRFEGKPLAEETIDYDAEIALQSGDFSSTLDHQALAFHAGVGYTLKKVKGTPRLGAQYNFATGDSDPDDAENKTFDNLYPTNHLHYGYIDFFSWRNMHNVKLESSVKPVDQMSLKGDLHFFWLDTAKDAWYNAGGGKIRSEDPARDVDSSVGREIDITAEYTCDKHFGIVTGYSYFFTGSFVESTGHSDNPNWFFLQTTFSL